MRIYSRMVGALYVLTGTATAVALLTLWASSGGLLVDFAGWASGDNVLVRLGIAGLVLLLLGIVWVVFWFDACYRNRAVVFNNPGGRVNVSLRAIEEFVTSRILTQIPGAQGIRVTTALTSRGLETLIRLQLVAGINVPETCAHIQEITKNYLQDVVGVERIAAIDIFVSNILARDAGLPADAPPAGTQETQDSASS